MDYTQRLERKEQVITDYLTLVRAIGYGFHPDTRAEQYLHLPDGYTCAQVNDIVRDAFLVCEPYLTALEFFESGMTEAAGVTL